MVKEYLCDFKFETTKNFYFLFVIKSFKKQEKTAIDRSIN